MLQVLSAITDVTLDHDLVIVLLGFVKDLPCIHRKFLTLALLAKRRVANALGTGPPS